MKKRRILHSKALLSFLLISFALDGVLSAAQEVFSVIYNEGPPSGMSAAVEASALSGNVSVALRIAVNVTILNSTVLCEDTSRCCNSAVFSVSSTAVVNVSDRLRSFLSERPNAARDWGMVEVAEGRRLFGRCVPPVDPTDQDSPSSREKLVIATCTSAAALFVVAGAFALWWRSRPAVDDRYYNQNFIDHTSSRSLSDRGSESDRAFGLRAADPSSSTEDIV